MIDDRVALKQQVKEANDIVDVVGEYVTLRQVGPTYKGVCPFHDDHRPSFDVDPRRQRYRCWACNKSGDVFSFVQETQRVSFPEALELLARRVGISLENTSFSKHGPSRARMLDVTSWAAAQFHECLLDSPLAETARIYLGERRLAGETVRRFGLGFAPGAGYWLVERARKSGQPLDLMEQVGLIAKWDEQSDYRDRFRDRIIFPIRDMRGQVVGFGGRILPSSPLSARGPKYYNSAETFLFSKSDQLYGIDQARGPAARADCLAVVEGYTDVLMAHQFGIAEVVATMGTALNIRHVKKLRGVVSRVVLVFDADAGGATGVDRALEVFVSRELDLRIATLPEGLDPCDLLVQRGAEAFRTVLDSAVDVFEFKLGQVWKDSQGGVDARARAVEQMLAVLAKVPDLRTVKMELMVNRIAHRLSLKEETVWTRLGQLHAAASDAARRQQQRAASPHHAQPTHATHADSARPGLPAQSTANVAPTPGQSARPAANSDAGDGNENMEARLIRPPRHEVELFELLLAEPTLVEKVGERIRPVQIEHPSLRHLLEELYRLQAEGLPADLDHLRHRLDNEPLMAKAQDLQQRGLDHPDRAAALDKVLERYAELQRQHRTRELKNQLQSTGDLATALEILKQLPE